MPALSQSPLDAHNSPIPQPLSPCRRASDHDHRLSCSTRTLTLPFTQHQSPLPEVHSQPDSPLQHTHQRFDRRQIIPSSESPEALPRDAICSRSRTMAVDLDSAQKHNPPLFGIAPGLDQSQILSSASPSRKEKERVMIDPAPQKRLMTRRSSPTPQSAAPSLAESGKLPIPGKDMFTISQAQDAFSPQRPAGPPRHPLAPKGACQTTATLKSRSRAVTLGFRRFRRRLCGAD